MVHTLSLLSILFLSVSGLAKPLPRSGSTAALPITRKLNPVNASGQTVVKIDQDRAMALRQRTLHGPNNGSPEPVTNAVVTYTANVGVGSPATQYDLIVDTGSSNTWVGAGKPYTKTNTSHPTIDTVEVTYGSGMFAGKEYNDRVTLSLSLIINNQGIGAAMASKASTVSLGTRISHPLPFNSLGPVDLTVGTLFPQRSKSIPTVVDNLHIQGKIPSAILGVSFDPITSSQPNGELSFGGPDPNKYTGDITYTPITHTSPASSYWGIDMSATYKNTQILAKTAGIVDTGTTLILIASDAFQAYKTATGGVSDSQTGLLKITDAQYDALEPLIITVAGKSLKLSTNAQIWPRSLNTAIGGAADSLYLVVSDIGQNSGSGLDFILGYTFLERFYSVYDTANTRVGLATTSFTDSTTN